MEGSGSWINGIDFDLSASGPFLYLSLRVPAICPLLFLWAFGPTNPFSLLTLFVPSIPSNRSLISAGIQRNLWHVLLDPILP